jgi:hypothetical protein
MTCEGGHVAGAAYSPLFLISQGRILYGESRCRVLQPKFHASAYSRLQSTRGRFMPGPTVNECLNGVAFDSFQPKIT